MNLSEDYNDILIKIINNNYNHENKDYKILLVSTQFPGYGGGATNTYSIYNLLKKKKGIKVCIIFLDNDYFKLNQTKKFDDGIYVYPHHNPNIDTFSINTYLKGRPDIIYAKNYLAFEIMNNIYNNIPIIYLVSGSLHATFLSKYKISAQRILQANCLNFKKYINGDIGNLIQKEKNILSECKYCIFNSKLTYYIFKKFYSDVYFKYIICNTSNLYLDSKINNIYNHPKNVDIIFIVSNINREVKNAKLVIDLFKHKNLEMYSKIIIGNNSKNIIKYNIKNLKCYDLLDHDKVLYYLSISKLLVIPSYFDSSPNVLNEAIRMNCDVITSKNIGSYAKIQHELVCDDVYDINEWLNKISNYFNTIYQ